MMPRNSNTIWTEEDDCRLLEMKAEGKSNFAIAAAFRRSSAAIAGRLGILRARGKSVEPKRPQLGRTEAVLGECAVLEGFGTRS
jgi:hypothetical protein